MRTLQDNTEFVLDTERSPKGLEGVISVVWTDKEEVRPAEQLRDLPEVDENEVDDARWAIWVKAGLVDERTEPEAEEADDCEHIVIQYDEYDDPDDFVQTEGPSTAANGAAFLAIAWIIFFGPPFLVGLIMILLGVWAR